jgi:hypothetical protein
MNPAVLRHLNAHEPIKPVQLDRTTDFDRRVYLDNERARWRWVPTAPTKNQIAQTPPEKRGG